MNKFSKVAVYKLNIRNIAAFLYKNELIERETKKNPIYDFIKIYTWE